MSMKAVTEGNSRTLLRIKLAEEIRCIELRSCIVIDLLSVSSGLLHCLTTALTQQTGLRVKYIKLTPGCGCVNLCQAQSRSQSQCD